MNMVSLYIFQGMYLTLKVLKFLALDKLQNELKYCWMFTLMVWELNIQEDFVLVSLDNQFD